MSEEKKLDWKYRAALKAIGQKPTDKIYQAAEMFLPIVSLLKLKKVVLSCKTHEEYLEVLDYLEIPNEDRLKGGFLSRSIIIPFAADQTITIRIEIESNEKLGEKPKKYL